MFQFSLRYVALCVVLVATTLLAQNVPAGTQPAATQLFKDAIPDAATLKSAISTVNSAFKNEIAAAQSPEQMKALLLKMLNTAKDEKGATRYAIILEVRDTAIQLGDPATCDLALDALNASFDIDMLKLRSDACHALVQTVGSPTDRKNLLVDMSKLVHDTLFVERFDLARDIAPLAVAGANAVGDNDLIQTAMFDAHSIVESQSAFTDLKSSLTMLASKPDDPAANLKVGKYRCYFKADWAGGLLLLAKCGDDPQKLKPLADLDILAEKDLAVDKELPLATTTDDQVKLGDSWWDISNKEKGLAQKNVRQHAAYWYFTAMPSLTGLTKARVQERLDSDKSLIAPPPRPAPYRNFAGRWVRTSNGNQAFDLNIDGTTYSESDKNTGHWTVNPEGTMIKIVWDTGGWSDTYRHYTKNRWIQQAFKDGKPYTSAIIAQPEHP